MTTVVIQGFGKVNFPDDMAPQEIESAIKRDIEPVISKRRQDMDADMRRMADPTTGMSGFEKARAGFGKAFSDIGQGIKQNLGLASREDVAETRKLDAPLMKSGAGLTGNVVGNVAALVPTLAIPGANTVGGAALIGAGTGALMPSESTGETLLNVGGGAALSGVAQKGVNLLTKPIASSLTPEQTRLAQAAAQEGIPLTPAQQTGSKALKAIDAGFENIPSTAGAQAASRQAQQEAFNRAALKRAGIQGNTATPEALVARKGALGRQFEDIAGRNAVKFDDQLINDVGDIVENASRRLTTDKAATVGRAVDDILEQVNNGTLTGKHYQAWRTELRRLAKNDDQGHYFGQLKKALDSAFDRQVSGADAKAWKQTSREYGNLKTILDAMGGPGINPASGNIQPAQLNRALAASMGREGKALGRGDLNELSRIGQTFLADRVPDSGTAQRLLAQGILTGGAGAAITGDPAEALKYGMVGLAAPKLAQSILMSKPVQRAMLEGAITNPRLTGLLRPTPQAALLPMMSQD